MYLSPDQTYYLFKYIGHLMLILTLPLHEKGLHQESFFRYQTHTLMQKAALGQLFIL